MSLQPRIANRFRMLKYTRISHQPQESKHAGPRQTDRTGTVELLIEPVSRNTVLSVALSWASLNLIDGMRRGPR